MFSFTDKMLHGDVWNYKINYLTLLTFISAAYYNQFLFICVSDYYAIYFSKSNYINFFETNLITV